MLGLHFDTWAYLVPAHGLGCPKAYGIFVPPPGSKPKSLALLDLQGSSYLFLVSWESGLNLPTPTFPPPFPFCYHHQMVSKLSPPQTHPPISEQSHFCCFSGHIKANINILRGPQSENGIGSPGPKRTKGMSMNA